MAKLHAKGSVTRDTRGVTVVEFAIVAPVLGLLLLAAFDIAHALYMRATLQGIVQKTGRDSTLESSASSSVQTELDNKVKRQALALANNATIEISRRFYRTFSEAAEARAEAWTDTNGNGTCDASEPYQDANQNNAWDRDGGNDGQGGAKDATYYTVTVTYPRMFPLYNLIGGGRTTSVSATTILRNQPYGDQSSYSGSLVRNCPAALLAPLPATPVAPPTPITAPSATPSAVPSCNVGLLGVCVL